MKLIYILIIIFFCCSGSTPYSPYGFIFGTSIENVKVELSNDINCLCNKTLIVICKTMESPSGVKGDYILTFNNHHKAVGLISISNKGKKIASPFIRGDDK